MLPDEYRMDEFKPRLFLAVRHGQTVRNQRKRGTYYETDEERAPLRDVPDSETPLSPEGAEQMRRAGRALRAFLEQRYGPDDAVVDEVVLGDYLRHRQSLELLLEAFPPEDRQRMRVSPPSPALRERASGAVFNLLRSEVEARYPEYEATRRVEGIFRTPTPGGECMDDVRVRVRDYFVGRSAELAGQRVLYIGSDGPIHCLRANIEGLPSEQAERRFHEKGTNPNGGVFVFAPRTDGGALAPQQLLLP